MKKKISLEKFFALYIEFENHPSWTKEKRLARDKLHNYFESIQNVEIKVNRDSPTKKVHSTNDFIIFKVDSLQRGKMLPYRNKWVLMCCTYRHTYNHDLSVFPLKRSSSYSKIAEVIFSLNNEYKYFLEKIKL